MNPITLEPHWTAYLTALLTPVVAIVAAYVAIINARTARNKLKLDLFDRRIKVFTTIRDIVRTTIKYEALDDAAYTDLVNAFNDAEWLFDANVHKHFASRTLPLYEAYTTAIARVRNAKFADANKILPAAASEKKLSAAKQEQQNAAQALAVDEPVIVALLAPFLRLSH
ncbi:hypothetical protein J2W39_000039 [Variovorax paradoxus]|uniref:DUF4760 domain-containing protein n=1 Tax=Variovorax paradoxus TaxID=34073 RepID=A0AAW8E7Z0_VARPD|nr:hypothetical protein [Variovorax paradoxus]MDP9968816.1 hypothetical protein [Variovorax paradoxus]